MFSTIDSAFETLLTFAINSMYVLDDFVKDKSVSGFNKAGETLTKRLQDLKVKIKDVTNKLEITKRKYPNFNTIGIRSFPIPVDIHRPLENYMYVNVMRPELLSELMMDIYKEEKGTGKGAVYTIEKAATAVIEKLSGEYSNQTQRTELKKLKTSSDMVDRIRRRVSITKTKVSSSREYYLISDAERFFTELLKIAINEETFCNKLGKNYSTSVSHFYGYLKEMREYPESDDVTKPYKLWLSRYYDILRKWVFMDYYIYIFQIDYLIRHTERIIEETDKSIEEFKNNENRREEG